MSDRNWTISVCPECDALIEQDDGPWACEHRVLAHEGAVVEVVPAAEVERLQRAWEKDNLCGICPYRKAVQAENDRLRARQTFDARVIEGYARRCDNFDEVERLADAIERDRREPDKVLCHLLTLRRVAR